ncbi:MAG: tetratricopeptide repeat protein [Arenicella sp.]|nr:tetratricopeptide repeat protein [Arenicella sp.]
MSLTGCVTSAVAPDAGAVAEEGPALESAQQDELPPLQKNLPHLELDAALLEQLLTANMASYKGDWKAALDNAFAAAQTSQDPRVARLAAMLALRSASYQQATTAAKLWATVQPDNKDANTTLQLAQVGAGQVDEVLQNFDSSRGDKTIDVHIKEIAGLLVRQSNADAAIQIVEHYVAEFPASEQVLLSSSYVAESFEFNELAAQWLDEALKIKPGWDLAAQMKASMLRRQGKSADLMSYIEQFLVANPGSIAMRMNLAAEQAREKSFEEALVTVQQVLLDDPKNVAALTYAAALAQQLEQPDLAQQYYQRAIKEDPADEEVRWALARRAAQDERFLEAEKHFQRIVSEENFLRAQLQVANMRFHTRNLREAINTLRALQPQTQLEYVDVAITRHYLLMQAREYEEAMGYINETLVYLPDNTELKYARALVAAELKEVETAEQDLRYIISLQPEHANALNALGYTLADQTDRYVEAKELITKALELRPEDAHILDSMGWVLYRMEDYAGALEYLRKAYSASDEVEVAAHLGEVLWESGQAGEAREIWSKAMSDDAENPLLLETLERYSIEFDTGS